MDTCDVSIRYIRINALIRINAINYFHATIYRYDIMFCCWKAEPEERPSFEILEGKLTKRLMNQVRKAHPTRSQGFLLSKIIIIFVRYYLGIYLSLYTCGFLYAECFKC